jgi:hypothetical protein
MKNGFIDLKQLAKFEQENAESPLSLKVMDEMLTLFLLIDDVKPNDDTLLDETRSIILNTLEKNKIFKRIGQ